MITPAIPPPVESAIPVAIQDIRSWRVPFRNETGETTGFGVQNSPYSNLEATKRNSINAWDKAQLVQLFNARQERRLKQQMLVFTVRYEADKSFFESIDRDKIFLYCKESVETMLAFFPTKLSADVTPDMSVVVQAFYGDLHFFWETHFDPEEEISYSTLNVTSNNTIVFSKGATFPHTRELFINMLTSLSHAALNAQ